MRLVRSVSSVLATCCLLLALSGCGEDTEGVSDDTGQNTLEVTVTSGPGADPITWTLTCDPAGGDHPDPGGACSALERVEDPFAPVPADMGCTQVYGGPETATVTGTWHGKQVSAEFRRTDGCEIARWDAIAAVLAPGGAPAP